MDKQAAKFAATVDGDLALCLENGMAYQLDMQADRVPYDSQYLAKCQAYEGSAVANAVNDGRCALIERQAAPGCSVLDIGAATGAFVRMAAARGFAAKGYDVIPQVAEHLRASGLFDNDLAAYDVVTFWDSLEHMEDPGAALAEVNHGSIVCVSLPIFADLNNIRESKHYRPGEHLYHWTEPGFVAWMAGHGFELLEMSDHETLAGRESIGAFAFLKVF